MDSGLQKIRWTTGLINWTQNKLDACLRPLERLGAAVGAVTRGNYDAVAWQVDALPDKWTAES